MAEKPADMTSKVLAALEEMHGRLDEFAKKVEPDAQKIAMIAIAALAPRFEEISRQLLEVKNGNKAEEVLAKIGELIETLNRPTVRESVVNLPSGPVTMRVTESR